MEKTFFMHTDPGHGWLEVTVNDLEDVNLSFELFSSCSFVGHNHWRFWLEEDLDAPLFMAFYKQKYGTLPKIQERYHAKRPAFTKCDRLPGTRFNFNDSIATITAALKEEHA